MTKMNETDAIKMCINAGLSIYDYGVPNKNSDDDTELDIAIKYLINNQFIVVDSDDFMVGPQCEVKVNQKNLCSLSVKNNIPGHQQQPIRSLNLVSTAMTELWWFVEEDGCLCLGTEPDTLASLVITTNIKAEPGLQWKLTKKEIQALGDVNTASVEIVHELAITALASAHII